MLKKLFQKYALNMAIATLAILALLTVLACIVLGLKTGLIVGIIIIILLDGTTQVHHDLDDLAGSWVADDKFDQAVKAMDQIDPELWK